MKRRDFIKKILVSSASITIIIKSLHESHSRVLAYQNPHFKRKGILRPPGSLEESSFLSKCIRCQRCQEVCRADAINLFGSGTGVHQGTPYIIAEDHACNLCLECGKACPTDAIEVLQDKNESQMGLAIVDENSCVSHNDTGICGSCFTICPLRGKAITQGFRNKPYVHEEYCVGCGLCEEVCIVKGDKAIQVFTKRKWQ